MSELTSAAAQELNESGFPIDPVVIEGLAIDYTESVLRRESFVHSCLSPEVNTNGDCKLKIIDFRKTFDEAGAETHRSPVDALQASDNTMTCYSNVKEVEAPSFHYSLLEVKWHANKINMTDCCLSSCGISNYENLVRDLKLDTLVNKYLVNKELAQVDAIATAPWVAATEADFMACTAGIALPSNGKKITMTTSFCDRTFEVDKFIENVHAGNLYGRYNVAVISRKAYQALKRNDYMRGIGGCVVPPQATEDNIKAILGVDKICIADAAYNAGGVFGSSALGLDKFWNEGWILLAMQSNVTSSEDARNLGNFSVNYQKYSPYFRSYRNDEAGENGIDWLSHHYSVNYCTNVDAGVLIEGVF